MSQSGRIAAITALICLLSLGIWQPAAGKSKNTRKPSSSSTSLEIKDTEKFFEWFRSIKWGITNRNEFETAEDYRKRLPPPFNSTKVIFFRAEAEHTFPSYSYDADTQVLTFKRRTMFTEDGVLDLFAGEDSGCSADGVPIVIHEVSQKEEPYTASNALGASVLVEKTYDDLYILNLLNTTDCPYDLFDSETNEVFIRLSVPPKTAKYLSTTLEVAIGVRLLDYQRSSFGCVAHTNPTFSRPRDHTLFANSIDAYLAKVVLYDKASKRPFLTRIVGN